MDTKKLLKIAGISSLLLVTGTASAGWKYNFLLGGSAGYGWQDGDVNIRDLQYGNVPPRGIVGVGGTKVNLADSGFVGGVFGGIQAKCNRLLFGLEVAADWSNMDSTHAYAANHIITAPLPAVSLPYNSTLKYDRGTVIGLSARAGYQMFSWLMPYVRLGAETSDDTLTYTANAGNANIVRLNKEDSTRVWRFLAGVGVEFPLFWHLNGRVEYNYASKGEAVKLHAVSFDTPVVANATPQSEHFVDTKQDQHTAKASIVWNFPAI